MSEIGQGPTYGFQDSYFTRGGFDWLRRALQAREIPVRPLPPFFLPLAIGGETSSEAGLELNQ
jgi:hypothetical protein